MPTDRSEESSPRGNFLKSIREFLFGMSGYEFEQHAVEMRASLETLFMTVTFGDIVGMPVIPPYYSLRLLPYIVPNIASWKRRVLREREFSDSDEFDMHGI